MMEASLLPVSLIQKVRTQQSFCTHDVQNIDYIYLDTIEYAARWDDDFPIR